MEIIYNPPNGSKIEHFIYGGVGELAPHDVGELKQYDPHVADTLLKTFDFLQKVTPQKAIDIQTKSKQGAFKCEYCDFSTDHKVALAGHMKSHAEEIAKAKEPVIDPSIIPVAAATSVSPRKSPSVTQQEELTADKGFYGEGLTIT